MKRRYIPLLAALIFQMVFAFAESPYYLSSGMEGKRLAVHNTIFHDLNAADQAVLHDLDSIIRMDLHDYAGFSVIDAQNLERIEQLQAASEDDKYASETQLRAGKLQYAEYEAFITVGKTSGQYSLKVTITNLETAVILAEHLVTKVSKVTDIEDSAEKELLLAILPKIGIELTGMGRYAITGGSTGNLSAEQEYAYAEESIKNLQVTLADFDRQLTTFASSSALLDQKSIAAKAELETQRQLTEQKLLLARQKAERIEEMRKKQMEDAIAANERSQAANEKIREISGQVESAAAKIRNQQFSDMTFVEQITVIEKEKKAYLDLRQQIESEIAELQQQTIQEFARLSKDPDDRSNYESFELDATGTPFEAPRNVLIQENQDLYDRLQAEQNAAIRRLKNTADRQLDEIRKDIDSKQKRLSKKQTLNSLIDENLLTIGSYDMNENCWNATVSIVMNGTRYYSEQIQLNFNDICKAVEGKTYSAADMAGKNGRENYTAYRDTAAAFESLFRMGTPFIYLEADFTVTAMDFNNPSGYEIAVSEYRLYYTNGNTAIRKLKSDGHKQEIHLTPAFDLCTEEDIARYCIDMVRQDDAAAYRKNDSGVSLGIGVPNGGTSFGFYVDAALFQHAFLEFSFGVQEKILSPAYTSLDSWTGKYVTEQVEATYLNADISMGYAHCFPVWSLPVVYGELGYGAMVAVDTSNNYSSYITDHQVPIQEGTYFKLGLGADLPIIRTKSHSLNVFLKNEYFKMKEKGFNRILFGASINSSTNWIEVPSVLDQ